VLSISLGGKVSGVKPEGQLGIAALRHFYPFRHAGLDPASSQPKSLGWKDPSRRADARRLDSGSRPEWRRGG